MKKMRRIALFTILSLTFLFSFAAVAFAEAPKNGAAGAAGTPKNPGYLAPVIPAITATVIHSNYTANTDACASCHATHTAVGANLLQWSNTSTACMACHDGTVTSTYNVEAGLIAATATKTSGGLFGVLGTETGLSKHNVASALTTSGAMGGSEALGTDLNGNWSTSFSCATCHSPHGQGGNDRILNADPNGIAMQNKVLLEILTATTPGTTYTAAKANWIAGYPYSAQTKIYVDAVLKTTGYTINYRTGVVTFAPAVGVGVVVTADYVSGINVVMGVAGKLTAGEAVTYTSGMNQFCGACHTDYNTSKDDGLTVTASGHTLNGEYRSAYRHQVGMNWDDTANGATALATLKFEGVSGTMGKVMCLTCHYAHGTDDAFVGGVTSNTGLSTALKRQVNMSVCETCHQKGAASNY